MLGMIFPGLKSKQQDQSILSRWIKELIRKVCLGCSDQNLLRLPNGIMLCPRGKRGVSIDYCQVGIACALKNIREIQTMDFWESVQHRNGECRARGEKASRACLCHHPFTFLFPPLLCLYFLTTLNSVKKNLGEVLDHVAVGVSAGS